MRLIFRVVVGFVVVAALTLLVLVYLEGKNGLNTSPSAILEDVKDAGKAVGEKVDGFLEDSGIKQGAADLLQKGADVITGTPGKSPMPSPTASPTASPTTSATPKA